VQRDRLQPSVFYQWHKQALENLAGALKRYGKVNEHNALVPRDHWLLDEEKRAIIGFTTSFPSKASRLTFMKRFGHPPTELPGSLADDNKAIFQRKYVEELDKGVDPTTAEQLAAAETPYVKARAKLE
jgi:hypothetical protein